MKSANFPRIIWKKRGLSKKSFEGNSKGFSGKTAKKKIPLAKCYNNFRKVYFMHKSIFTLYFTYYLYGNCLAKNRKPVPSMNPQQKSTTLSRKNIFKINPEGRIRRYQFSVRTFIPRILISILFLLLVPYIALFLFISVLG